MKDYMKNYEFIIDIDNENKIRKEVSCTINEEVAKCIDRLLIDFLTELFNVETNKYENPRTVSTICYYYCTQK